MMTTNEAGRAIIKLYEGLRLRAYKCPAGIWTVGYGHTGPDVYEGLTITPAQAENLLAGDLTKFERVVAKEITVGLNENQFSALVSFTYNVGPGNFASSTLVRVLNEGRYLMVPAQLKRWNKTGGQVLAGLTARRAAEGVLFGKAA